MTLEEVKHRRLANHYLIEKGEKLTVVRDLNGFQAQFMSNALHSMKLRCRDYSPETAGDGLVKNWTVRGTVHFFAESDLPLFRHGGGRDEYGSLDFRGYKVWRRPDGSYSYVDTGGCERVWALTPERQGYFARFILEALKKEPLSREELKELCAGGGMTEVERDAMFDQWGGGIRELCERGFMDYLVQEKKAFCLAPPFTPLDAETAELELARRYFTHFAPATVRDAQYYFHQTAAKIKDWLSRLPVQAFDCGGRTYYYIENGRDCGKPAPDCILLAGFDQLMLGYEKRESLFIAPEHIRGVFNLAGIVMPPLLLHGQVAGRWRKRGGTLEFTLFRGLSEAERRGVQDAAEEIFDDIRRIEWK